MAAATAFFSLFALPPIVIILSQLYEELFDEHGQRLNYLLIRKLAELVGYQSARQLQDISRHLQQERANPFLTGLSIVLLLGASTTLFAIIKNSLNQLWRVKTIAKRQVWHLLVDRVIALGIILFSGLLFTVSLAIRRTLLPLKDNLEQNAMYDWSTDVGQHLLSILMLTVWFAVIFKYLPDIRIRWPAVWVGALVTGILVEAGEQVLDRFLITSSVRSLFGASGSIMLILLFVFYSSLIFYYGASFTRHFAQWIHLEAEPGAHAVAYQITEVDRPNAAGQDLQPPGDPA
ncbi:YihY/virulence factor BrkB family protein [Larkinella humicola]|uniref:YihY/virulence factor BrkB family protein n=2 Tax=Larkinella humicola TaxID=2607654 RepID=A0A5N1JPC5_9BACT|nr:YihY/virulence factor BrkB family protein [Larkinella humicola]